MPITIPAVPTFTDPDDTATDTTAHSQAWAMMNAKYADAGAWAAWAAGVMNSALVEMSLALGSDTVETDINALSAEIGEILAYIPGTISGGDGVFSDTLLTALKNKLSADIAANSTGLGSVVEAAMFARETARQNTIRAKAYDEVTTVFSSKGWDMPPGAMVAKMTEINNESSLRLAEGSGKILEETTRLALDYNKHIQTVSLQLIDALARVFESKEARAFEASKATVMLGLESYKSSLGLVTAKADIILKKGELSLASKARQLQLEVETMRAVAQGFQQMVASAMNGVNASTSFGFSGSANTSYVGT